MRALPIVLSTVLCLAAADSVSADAFPLRAVQIIVPYTPGGVTDLYARVIATELAKRWGQPVVVENRPGAGTVLGTQSASRAPADGHTLLLTSYAFTANQALMPTLPYDPASLTPLVMLGNSNSLLAVNPELPAHTLDEVIMLARHEPGALRLASSGNGSSPHIAAALFGAMAGAQITHVPYKGTAPAMNDIYGGLVDGIFDGPSVMSRVAEGKLRPIAIMAPTRHALAPDVPTFTELGHALVFGSWFGFFVPRDTPPAIQDTLYADLRWAIDLPQTRERIAHGGLHLVRHTPAQFGEFLDQELDRLRTLVDQNPDQFPAD